MNVTKEQLVEKLDQLEKAYREWSELGDNIGELFGWDFKEFIEWELEDA